MLCAEIKGYHHGKYRNILLRTDLPAQRKDGEHDSQQNGHNGFYAKKLFQPFLQHNHPGVFYAIKPLMLLFAGFKLLIMYAIPLQATT